jgi:hypothetical protein
MSHQRFGISGEAGDASRAGAWTMTLTKIAAAATCLVLWTNCAAAYTNAEQLIRDCTVTAVKPDDAFVRFRCLGYVSGVLDAYASVSGLYRNVNLYCAPQQGLTVDAAVGALVQWGRLNPGDAGTPGRTALLLALKGKYPCR